jgi:hypothetical protein
MSMSRKTNAKFVSNIQYCVGRNVRVSHELLMKFKFSKAFRFHCDKQKQIFWSWAKSCRLFQKELIVFRASCSKQMLNFQFIAASQHLMNINIGKTECTTNANSICRQIFMLLAMATDCVNTLRKFCKDKKKSFPIKSEEFFLRMLAKNVIFLNEKA